ncbi:MAG: DUF1924 domain-containing protein [Xanthobacteraceae bacterium]
MHVFSVNKEAVPLARTIGAAALVFASVVGAFAENSAQRAVLDRYLTEAKTDPGYFGPSAERGRVFFFAAHAGGKADTPACTACHSRNLAEPGQTKAGKPIEPMAASLAPSRYSDPATVEKWFRRNCHDVLGRACSAAEKADVLTFLLSL